MSIKILVTGSSGFIGYHLCGYLLKKNFNLCGIDSHNKYYSEALKKKKLSKKKKISSFLWLI